jgi:hypothetical protein
MQGCAVCRSLSVVVLLLADAAVTGIADSDELVSAASDSPPVARAAVTVDQPASTAMVLAKEEREARAAAATLMHGVIVFPATGISAAGHLRRGRR